MKRAILTVLMVLIASTTWALDVTQIVFSRTSSALPETANVRITPFEGTLIKDTSKTPLQGFVWRAGKTENLFLGESITFPLGTAIGAWIQVDQATNIKVNSESSYMTLPAGFNDVILFE